MRSPTVRLLTALAAVGICLVGAGGVALASPATSDTGPELTAPGLESSLTCFGDLSDGSAGAPVLLVHGTGLTPEVNYDWNYAKAFAAEGRPYCWVALPNRGLDDVQIAAEHVVHAIRTMSERAGRRISVVGYSQGGMVPRWALKYWPDTRDDVEDVIGIDPSNHGTLDSYAFCATGCPPSLHQQGSGSNFLTALNDGPETWPGIDYTVVYTVTDEVVAPNLPPAASSELHTGEGAITNIAVQQICPVHVAEHLSMGSTDPVGYAVVHDALVHDGPAAATRIDPAVCGQVVMPAVDRSTLLADGTRYYTTAAGLLVATDRVPQEPPLRDYARTDATD